MSVRRLVRRRWTTVDIGMPHTPQPTRGPHPDSRTPEKAYMRPPDYFSGALGPDPHPTSAAINAMAPIASAIPATHT
jgi:hypothetical protein